MTPFPRFRSPVALTGGLFVLLGLALAGGGGWLAWLGGSIYYVVAGVALLVVGGLLIARRRAALHVFAALLFGTAAWSVYDIGFDWWPMAARVEPGRVQAAHQSLHHMVAKAEWSDRAVLAAIRDQVLPKIVQSGALNAWIIDDTGFPKKGS